MNTIDSGNAREKSPTQAKNEEGVVEKLKKKIKNLQE